VEWVVREGVGAGGEMNQALYAHMNNKRKMKKKENPPTQS
jgi:NaMN:DMB phosphoribosyltransferase